MFKNFISALFRKNITHKNRAGFSLIELLVVISIIMIMTAVVFINYPASNQQLALQRSAHKLAQDIRRAQEMAMSSKEEGVCGSGFSGGYGIRLSSSNSIPHYPWEKQYALFADCDNNREYGSGIDGVIEEVKYESGITLYRVQYWDGGWNPGGVGAGEPTVDIIFSPPDPERSVFTGDSDYDNAPEHKITLRTEDNRIKCIYVNKAGLIYVDDC